MYFAKIETFFKENQRELCIIKKLKDVGLNKHFVNDIQLLRLCGGFFTVVEDTENYIIINVSSIVKKCILIQTNSLIYLTICVDDEHD